MAIRKDDFELVVKNFFFRDDISKTKPLSKTLPHGQKQGRRANHSMLYTLGEAFCIFQEEHPQIEINFSTFCDIVPKRIQLLDLREPGYCLYCENIKKLFSAVTFKHNGKKIDSLQRLTEIVVCDINSEKCMMHKCSQCNILLSVSNFLRNSCNEGSEELVTCKQWHSCSLEQQSFLWEVFAANFLGQMIKYTDHIFTVNFQAKELATQISHVRDYEVVMLVDLAESCNSFLDLMKGDGAVPPFLPPPQGSGGDGAASPSPPPPQDGKKRRKRKRNKSLNITLYTAQVYYSENGNSQSKSYAVLSDAAECTPYEIWLYNNKILDDFRTNVTDVESVSFWSFANKRYFRNAETLAVLTNFPLFGAKASWHYHESFHGKEIHDKITTAVKRSIWRDCIHIVTKCEGTETLAKQISDKILPIRMLFAPQSEMYDYKKELHKVIDGVKPVPNLQSARCVYPIGPHHIILRNLCRKDESIVECKFAPDSKKLQSKNYKKLKASSCSKNLRSGGTECVTQYMKESLRSIKLKRFDTECLEATAETELSNADFYSPKNETERDISFEDSKSLIAEHLDQKFSMTTSSQHNELGEVFKSADVEKYIKQEKDDALPAEDIKDAVLGGNVASHFNTGLGVASEGTTEMSLESCAKDNGNISQNMPDNSRHMDIDKLIDSCSSETPATVGDNECNKTSFHMVMKKVNSDSDFCMTKCDNIIKKERVDGGNDHEEGNENVNNYINSEDSNDNNNISLSDGGKVINDNSIDCSDLESGSWSQYDYESFDDEDMVDRSEEMNEIPVNCKVENPEQNDGLWDNFNAQNSAQAESLWDDLNDILYSETDGVPYKCPQCEQVLSSRGNLKRHINTIHRGIRPFQCLECTAAFSEKRSMEHHVACVHDNLRAFKCSDCEQSFNTKCHLKKHIEGVHIRIRYKCPDCESPRFYTKTGLRIHYETTHNPSPDQDFLQRRRYKQKRVTCPECSATFSGNTVLRSHIMGTHKGIKPYRCLECPAKFCDIGKLRRHQNGVHFDLRPHKCLQCSSAFLQKWALRKHIQSTHLKIKNFVCPECETPFAERANLERHRSTVHKGIKAFQCRDCDTKYTQRAALKYHLTAAHKISLAEAAEQGYLDSTGNTYCTSNEQ